MQCVSLFSGSGGNAIFVKRGESKMLVDAGVSFRRLALALQGLGEDICALDGVFFTHEHSDHIGALGMLLKKTSLPFYLDAACAEGAYDTLLTKDPSLAAEFVRRVRTVEAGADYEIGELCLTPFALPHDSAACLGAVFSNDNGDKQLGIATDLGEMTTESRRALYGCSAVILESNHDVQMLTDGPYPPYLQERILS
ncbi:MAG: MBL fold metallo-hydrolase [Clostridia bacterium]|nr:MBL fold metallo-hydrolase [Clostridia bacterium]